MGNNEWTSMVDIVLDLIAAALIIALIVVLGTITQRTNTKLLLEDAAVAQVREYREYNTYDDKTLLGADVVSCLFTVRGKVPVTVCGVTYTVSSDYTIDTINALYPAIKEYHSTLIRDPEDVTKITGIDIVEGA